MSTYFALFLVLFELLWIDVSTIAARIFLTGRRLEDWLTRMSPRWSRTLLNLLSCYAGVDIQLESRGDLALPDHAVVLANHQHFLDILALFALLKDHPLRFVGKNSLKFGFPGASNVLRFGRHAFVRQSGDPMGAVQSVQRFARRSMKRGWCPVIFPEGTRSKDGIVRDFKTGGLRTITESAPLPFIVVAIDGGHSLQGFFKGQRGRRPYYRARVVQTFPRAEGKAATAAMLAEARTAIETQIKCWRT